MDENPSPSIEEVMQRDAEFQAAAAVQALDPAMEAEALQEIFEGSQRDLVEKACSQTLNAERWSSCTTAWSMWKDKQVLMLARTRNRAHLCVQLLGHVRSPACARRFIADTHPLFSIFAQQTCLVS
jgi:hypothetical protein